MIRQDFEQFPPRMFLMQILDNLAKLYIFLWEKRDKRNKLFINWSDLARYYNKNTFRTGLRKLNTEGLLNYDESPDGVSIEMVGWDEMEG